MIIFAFAENSIQLVPDGTLLLHLLIVMVMVAALNRTLFRPLNKVLAEREEQTSGRLSEAKKLQANVESGLRQYERGLREARSAAYHLVDSERTEALRQRLERVSEVKEEVRLWIDEQISEIERQTEDARQTLTSESSQSAVQISSRILHRPVNNSGTSRLDF